MNLLTCFRTAATAVLVSLLVACAHPPPPGQTRQQVLDTWGKPTATYVLTADAPALMPDSAALASRPSAAPAVPPAAAVERLEYATGPFGRTTWMIDIDAGGRVVASQQVLTEARFLQVQQTPVLKVDDLLRFIGTPGQRRAGGLAGGQVWSWRYPNNDCLWFQASVDDNRYVTSSGFGGDPMCDRGADFARGDRGGAMAR